MLLLAGCAEDLPEEDPGLEGELDAAPDADADDPAGTPSPSAPGAAPSPRDAGTSSTPTASTTPAPSSGTSPTPSPGAPRPIPEVRSGPPGDIDLDGIPDGTERALATRCEIAGATCASLGVAPPVVGHRDLVLVQFGRSGVERDWRLPERVWAQAKVELAEHAFHVQVADLGRRDDIQVEARWEDSSLASRYWHLWVVYDDPAKAVSEETAGSQKYDLITIQDRENDTEMLATILHETYHALLGELDSGRSACADPEVGGPGHSSDSGSVLYTSPGCETNDGSVYRLGRAETEELRTQPASVLREMNAPEWFGETA